MAQQEQHDSKRQRYITIPSPELDDSNIPQLCRRTVHLRSIFANVSGWLALGPMDTYFRKCKQHLIKATMTPTELSQFSYVLLRKHYSGEQDSWKYCRGEHDSWDEWVLAVNIIQLRELPLGIVGKHFSRNLILCNSSHSNKYYQKMHRDAVKQCQMLPWLDQLHGTQLRWIILLYSKTSMVKIISWDETISNQLIVADQKLAEGIMSATCRNGNCQTHAESKSRTHRDSPIAHWVSSDGQVLN